MVLNGVEYGEQVTVKITQWRPVGYFRVGLRTTDEDDQTTEYISWTARIVPAWCASAYMGIAPSFTYTPEVDEAMMTDGLKAWVLDDLGLEEYGPT
jgi:hypothetical protein